MRRPCSATMVLCSVFTTARWSRYAGVPVNQTEEDRWSRVPLNRHVSSCGRAAHLRRTYVGLGPLRHMCLASINKPGNEKNRHGKAGFALIFSLVNKSWCRTKRTRACSITDRRPTREPEAEMIRTRRRDAETSVFHRLACHGSMHRNCPAGRPFFHCSSTQRGKGLQKRTRLSVLPCRLLRFEENLTIGNDRSPWTTST